MINTEQLILGPETYENTRRMLESASEEDAIVALNAIEQSDFKKSVVYILLLYKESKRRNLWEKNCPDILKKIKNIDFSNDVIPYKEIYTYIKGEVSKKDMSFFLNRFSEQVKGYLINQGFKFMNELNVTITTRV